jgi:hypothetical protein
MGFALRYGNVVVAKMLEYLHNGPCLSDVGCTFKMFTREAIAAVQDYFTVGKSHFSPELMILCIRRRPVLISIMHEESIPAAEAVSSMKIVHLSFLTKRLEPV